MKKNTNLIYENQCLRNTNYYLLCTIYNLEKQKIEKFNEFIKKTEESALLDKNSIENELQFEIELDTNDVNDRNYVNDTNDRNDTNDTNDTNDVNDVNDTNDTNDVNDTNDELMNELEEKKTQYNLLSTELQNIKIEMEVQKEFSEHKIMNLELAKNLLEQELLDKREYKNKIEIDKSLVQEEEIIKKGNEIDKLKRENIMLTINNQQLQYELIRTIKQMQ